MSNPFSRAFATLTPPNGLALSLGRQLPRILASQPQILHQTNRAR